jgi:hypothetical protein
MPSANEIWEGRRGTGTFPRKRTYSRVFDVVTDNPGDGPDTAGTIPGIAHGDSHPEDATAFCVSIDPQQTDSPVMWRVTFGYDSHPDMPEVLQPDPGGGDPPTPLTPAEVAEAAANPLSRPIRWKVPFQQTQVPARRGRLVDPDTGDVGELGPITDSALLPFDPPVMIEVSRPIVTAVVNTATFSLAEAALLQDCTNSDTWQGMAPRTLRCVGLEAEAMQENGYSFWQRTYSLAVNWDTWDVRILDAGYQERIPGFESPGGGSVPDRWAPIKSDHGDSAGPYPLDGNGRLLTPGDEPVERRYRVFREQSFSERIG